MIKHVWSVLCRSSVIDKETNNISLNNVFEQLGVDIKIKKTASNKTVEYINIPIEYEIVSLWLKIDKQKSLKADIKIELVDPKNKTNKTFNQIINMSSEMKRLRSRLKIAGLTLSVPGDYFFRIKIKEEGQNNYRDVAELPLEVNLRKTVDLDEISKNT